MVRCWEGGWSGSGREDGQVVGGRMVRWWREDGQVVHRMGWSVEGKVNGCGVGSGNDC